MKAPELLQHAASIRPYKGQSNLAVNAINIFNSITGKSLNEVDSLLFFAVASQHGFSQDVSPKSKNNLFGEQFGRLNIIGLSPNGLRKHYTCRCDCGSLAHVCGSNLLSGKQLSCGCHQKEVRAKVAESRRTTKEDKLVVRRKASGRYAKTEKGRASHRKYLDKNKENILERCRKYHAKNPEVARSSVRNRRARLRNAIGKHTQQDIQLIGSEQGWKCASCDVEIASAYHVDHVHPLSKGGSNYPSNLQLLCAPCNLSKSDKSLNEFLRLVWPNLYLKSAEDISE